MFNDDDIEIERDQWPKNVLKKDSIKKIFFDIFLKFDSFPERNLGAID